jgi:predicted amidohydrolase
MKVSLVQFSPEWENPEVNTRKIDELMGNQIDSDLLIFPELTLTGFTMNSHLFAEEIDGISIQYFIELARKNKINIIAGFIEKYENKLFNTAIHFDRSGLICARYRKIHPYSYAGEDKYYNDSREIVITKVDGKLVGLSICYDLRFPELFRFYAKKNVEIMVNIANWPEARIHHWTHFLKSRAIENLFYMAGCNRIGEDPQNIYTGNSAIYDPMGNNLVTAPDKEGIFTMEFDLDKVKEYRDKFGFIRDIRLI